MYMHIAVVHNVYVMAHRAFWLPTKYTLDRSHLPIRSELAAARERANADGTDGYTGAFENAAFDRRASFYTWASAAAAAERIEYGARARRSNFAVRQDAHVRRGTTRRSIRRKYSRLKFER